MTRQSTGNPLICTSATPKIPLVSPNHPTHLPHMIRTKTHFLPLVSSLAAAATMPLAAQLEYSLSSRIVYRQNKEAIKFKGGSFDTVLTDGSVESIFPCNDPNYFPPGTYIGVCSPGTAGFLSSGSINGADIQRPYLVVTSLTPAFSIEPFKPQFVTLAAAPASTLPRPSAGFKDDSATIYYNLNTTEIQEYKITRYFQTKNYTKSEREKFQSEIVPGVYQYIFPGIVPVGDDFKFRPAPISATIYPMVEGYTKLNNTFQGVKFTSVNNNKWNNGFIELSYFRPNVIQWEGMTPNTVFAGVDNLYFSLRALRDPKNPDGSSLVEREAIFPAFDNGGDSRVLLQNPYQSQFTIPPIFPSGTKAMVELQLQRDFQTGGVTYDFSSRKFQIPVIVVNRYTEYQDINLAKTKPKEKDLLADPDKDGYNNLNEWILGSNGADRGSIPIPPIPAPYQAENIVGQPTPIGSYFGFNVTVQNATVPRVSYTLQRSTDQGKTWQKFTEDANWTVERVRTIIRNVVYNQIQVRSKIMVPLDKQIPTNPNWYVEPPGTLSDIYRVKITLKK